MEIQMDFRDICRQRALKYSYRASFQNSPAYKAAYKYDWLDEICDHMTKPKPYNYKWSFEECEKNFKYSLKKGFSIALTLALQIAKNKWLEEIYSHMTEVKKTS
jgi:hypothetical protein